MTLTETRCSHRGCDRGAVVTLAQRTEAGLRERGWCAEHAAAMLRRPEPR